MISLEPVDPAEAPAALGGYTQALSVRGASQLLFTPLPTWGVTGRRHAEACRRIAVG